jgi:hypothetical protein
MERSRAVDGQPACARRAMYRTRAQRQGVADRQPSGPQLKSLPRASDKGEQIRHTQAGTSGSARPTATPTMPRAFWSSNHLSPWPPARKKACKRATLNQRGCGAAFAPSAKQRRAQKLACEYPGLHVPAEPDSNRASVRIRTKSETRTGTGTSTCTVTGTSTSTRTRTGIAGTGTGAATSTGVGASTGARTGAGTSTWTWTGTGIRTGTHAGACHSLSERASARQHAPARTGAC